MQLNIMLIVKYLYNPLNIPMSYVACFAFKHCFVFPLLFYFSCHVFHIVVFSFQRTLPQET